MKKLKKNKFTKWLIVILLLVNIVTVAFFWGNHFKKEKDNSPKEFLARKLNFTDSQRRLYFELASDHNHNAKKIREQIKNNKDNLFQLLKSDTIIDSARNNAALKVSLSIQSLDILTFEHFKKVRALCSKEQKPKFDALIQKMVNSVNSPQKGPPAAIK